MDYDLDRDTYVSSDSAVNGSGIAIRRRSDDMPIAWGAAWVAEIIGSDHPALIYHREATELALSAQRESGRVLAQILRDGRRA